MLDFIKHSIKKLLQFNRWQPELIGLIAVAFFTRFWALFTPNAVVFDEVYFKMFCAHYLDGRYFFDIHPPLAKLLVAGWSKLLAISPDTMLNHPVVQLRILPALAGALLIPLAWGTLRRLGVGRPLAFLGATAVLLDNALLVESRFILMDSMLMLFGFGAVYFYLVARSSHTSRQRYRWLALSALAAGAATSTKWTGLTALILVLGMWAWDTRRRVKWPRRLKELALLLIIPAVVYLSAFWVHFALLPQSGDGDAFMSVQFQQTLVGNRSYQPTAKMSFWSKFVELNHTMYEANRTLTATHPYGSKWYTWPLDVRPVYYWQGQLQADGSQGNIYLLGNPIIWWGVLLTIFAGAVIIYRRGIKLPKPAAWGLAVTGIAWLINYLPFIGISRVMFIYHYFFAFVFSLIFAAILWNTIITHPTYSLSARTKKILFGSVLALMLLGFAFFMPISYGLPLSPAQLQAHVWLPSWR